MKTPRMAHAIGYMDDDLIMAATEAAAERNKKKKHMPWLKWGSVAACLLLLVITGAVLVPSFLEGRVGMPGGDAPKAGKYNKRLVSESEIAFDWPWAYKTDGEKYRTLYFNDQAFRIKSVDPVDAAVLGDVLGSGEAVGVDPYTEKQYTARFEVRRINGVSDVVLVAAGNESGFYVYTLDRAPKPATFGELMDLYGLEQTLGFDRFSVYEGYQEKGWFRVSDDASIWQILSDCRDAELSPEAEFFDRSNRSCLAFTVTSDALGVYKRVVYISENGYFATNIFDESYIYFIGEAAAAKIISDAKRHAAEVAFEPYEQTVSGLITEIGNGYVLIDDRVLCANEADGTVYKVFTGDIRMRRCIERMKVGDAVAVKYRGEISENHEIAEAYAMDRGRIVDNSLAVPE